MQNDSPSGNSDIAVQLEALQKAYTTELPNKVNEIFAYWKQLNDEGWDDSLASEIHRKTHSLSGSGTSFGFPMVSQCARELEIELKTIKELGALPDADKKALIELRLQELKNSTEISGDAPKLNESGSATHPYDPDLILLYEEHPDASKPMADELAKFGYHAEVYCSESKLADKLKQVWPASIVIFQYGDKSIPSFNAFKTEAKNSLPIIVIAENESFEQRLAAVRAGSNAFLTRNTDAGQLIDKIDRFSKLDEKEPFRILIIDDSETLATQYALILKQAGMLAEIVSDPLQISDKLSSFQPELMLVDMYMPDYNGAELARVLRQHEAYIGIPIVFLSAETNIDKQIGAISHGGDDFLTKPIHPEHLVSSIANRVERYRVLRTMMETDSLTGLLNHTRIKQRLEVELSRAERQQRPMSFAMIDLDDFKQVNDKYGHATGDQTLKLLSRVMQQRLRRTDIIGRYGGEEFAIILPDSDLDAATKLLDDVRQTFAEIPIHAGDKVFNITLSCGIASYPDYDNAAILNEAADQALYSAKKAGKNCIRIKRPE